MNDILWIACYAADQLLVDAESFTVDFVVTAFGPIIEVSI